MIEPGIYRMCHGGATLAKCVRMAGPLGVLGGLLLKLLRKRGVWVWLPDPIAERACVEDELSEECRRHLAPCLPDAAELGFHVISFVLAPRLADARFKDAGALWALHEDGRRILGAAYVHAQMRPDLPAMKRVTRYCSFLSPDLRATAVSSTKAGFDDPGWSLSIRLPGADFRTLDARLQGELSKHTGPVLEMASAEEALGALSLREEQWHERQVARGLYVKVSAEEQERLLREAGREGGAAG